MYPYVPVVFLEGISLPQHRVDVEASVHGAEIDEVLRREVLLGVVRRLGLALVVDLSGEGVWLRRHLHLLLWLQSFHSTDFVQFCI